MDSTVTWNSTLKPSLEEETIWIRLTMLTPSGILLGIIACIVCCTCIPNSRKVREGSSCVLMECEKFIQRPLRSRRSRGRFVESETANERISAATAETQALVTDNNVPGLEGRPTNLNALHNDRPRPNGNSETFIPSAPPAFSDSVPIFAPPPSYDEIVNSSEHNENKNNRTTELDPSWLKYVSIAGILRWNQLQSEYMSSARSQTPPPANHEADLTTVRIVRANSLPSYDDFMANPEKYIR